MDKVPLRERLPLALTFGACIAAGLSLARFGLRRFVDVDLCLDRYGRFDAARGACVVGPQADALPMGHNILLEAGSISVGLALVSVGLWLAIRVSTSPRGMRGR